MRIAATVNEQDARDTITFLDIAEKQSRFAAALAINRTLEEAQTELQQGLRERFTIRSEWVLRQVKFERGDRATKEKLRANLGIDRRAGFLEKFEEGGVIGMRQHRRIAGALGQLPHAVPTKALRPAKSSVIEKGLYPVHLGFTPRVMPNPRGPGDAIVFANRGHKNSRRKFAQKRYFTMRPGGQALDAGPAGVWVRTGSGAGMARGSDRITFLWLFRSQITVAPLLRFHATVDRVVDARLEENFRGFLEFAIRTAR